MSLRGKVVYVVLVAAWLVIVAWQAAEHARVRQTARTALINRARDISGTVGIVIRSQRHFGLISKERLESALTELVSQGELSGVALRNASGEVVASAGEPIGDHLDVAVGPAEVWKDQTVILMNLVDLGTNVPRDIELTLTNPPVIMSRQDFMRPDSNRPEPSRERPPPPPPNDAGGEVAVGTNALEAITETPPPRGRGRSRGGPDGRPRFPRPFWMDEQEFKAMIEKQGVHSFVLAMSTSPMHAASRADSWMRLLVVSFATVSVLGMGLAWRHVGKSAELQIRLVRASELNAHLKRMNVAAAGLAHETRNPLNIIRGLAQMISKQQEAAPETRKKSLEIMGEADRVTAQLNEFINYSRPREVRRAPLPLNSAVGEVARALSYDLEEKNIELQVKGDRLVVQADEQMFRQALFNLLLNAIQAVGRSGRIQVVAEKQNSSEAALEVRDNGPGVPPDRRTEIFKPYFTMQEKGTGLGLAVVQQIVLAHGWEIECLANDPRGAVFRITHLKLAA
jgi:signal transduction histidine kinase